MRSRRHFQVPRVEEVLAAVIVRGQKESWSDLKSILITQVTETIMDHICEKYSGRMKVFNRQYEASKGKEGRILPYNINI